MSFRYLPHTADLKAVVEAADGRGLYGEAAALLRDILVGDSAVRAEATRELRIESDDPAEKFFRFVRELIFLYDSEGFLPAAIEHGDPIRVLGECYDSRRHHSDRQIKALTRHEYSFDRDADGSTAVLLFDL